ncbi:4Fe-4S binding protein, partial [bacterium]|nr:4Fe-4S binding protein [bacterium]
MVLTLIFGRIYCSTLCPLGIYQEILMSLFKPFYKKSRQYGCRHFP